MTVYLAIDKEVLETVVAGLESRMIDPLALAHDLKAHIAKAPIAANAATLRELRQEVETYSPCRCKPKDGVTCRKCRLVA